jgi:hypothetical protein
MLDVVELADECSPVLSPNRVSHARNQPFARLVRGRSQLLMQEGSGRAQVIGQILQKGKVVCPFAQALVPGAGRMETARNGNGTPLPSNYHSSISFSVFARAESPLLHDLENHEDKCGGRAWQFSLTLACRASPDGRPR